MTFTLRNYQDGSDIVCDEVVELRKQAEWFFARDKLHPKGIMCEKSADEIERLRRQWAYFMRLASEHRDELDAEIEQLRSANGEAFRDAVKLACDDRMTEQKHTIREQAAEIERLRAENERLRAENVELCGAALTFAKETAARSMQERLAKIGDRCDGWVEHHGRSVHISVAMRDEPLIEKETP